MIGEKKEKRGKNKRSNQSKKVGRSLFTISLPPINIKWKGYYSYDLEDQERNQISVDHMIIDKDGKISGKGIDNISPYKMIGGLDAKKEKLVFQKLYDQFTIDFLGNWNRNKICGEWNIGGKMKGYFEYEPNWEKMQGITLKGWEEIGGEKEEMEFVVIAYKIKDDSCFVYKSDKIYSVGGDKENGGFTLDGKIDYQSMTLQFLKLYHKGWVKRYYGKLFYKKNGSWTVEGTWSIEGLSNGKFFYSCDGMDQNVDELIFNSVYLNSCFFDQNVEDFENGFGMTEEE